MIDKSTMGKESFLLILPKTEAHQLRKPKDMSIAAAKWMATVISIGLIAGLVSMFIDSSYIDINEFIAASMMMPTKVLEWVREIDIFWFVNQISLPFLVMALFILVVAKLVKPNKD